MLRIASTRSERIQGERADSVDVLGLGLHIREPNKETSLPEAVLVLSPEEPEPYELKEPEEHREDEEPNRF